MRIVRLLVVFGACAKSTPAPDTPSNTTSSAAPVETTQPAASAHAFVATGNSLSLGPAGTCTVGGETVDKQTREALVGVTLVVTTGTASEPMISDERGRFLVHRGAVPEVIHAYYADLHAESPFQAAWCGQAIRIELQQNNESIDIR